MPTRTGYQPPLLIRIDPETRRTLKAIATSSDRTMSQLVRYATIWWTANPHRTCPSPGVGVHEANKAEFVNVRFATEDMNLIRTVAAEMNLERGSVIRCAVRAWLTNGDFTALGDPRLLTTPDPARNPAPTAVA